MSSSTPTAPRQNTYGVVTLGLLAAAMVATGAPDAETAAWVAERGVPTALAVPAMYVIPIAAIVAALLLARALGRGRPFWLRWTLYGVLGAAGGFVMGLCLELFAGVPGLITALIGPMAEATMLDMCLWVIGTMCIVLGLMIGGIALFGRNAVAALQVEETTEIDFEDLRRAERRVFAWSSAGMLALGVACCALAVMRQAEASALIGPLVVAIAAAGLSVVASYVLWRGFDEMQRRHVVDGYSVSAIVLTVGSFVWALFEPLGYAPPLSATGVFLALIFVQLLATSYVTSAAVGQINAAGKPA